LAFVLVCALIWLALSIIVAADLHPALPESDTYKWIIAGLSFLSAGFLLILFFLLRCRIKIAYFLSIAFLLFIVLLTIMDDFGLSDFIIVMITLTPIVLLIKNHQWFLKKPDTRNEE